MPRPDAEKHGTVEPLCKRKAAKRSNVMRTNTRHARKVASPMSESSIATSTTAVRLPPQARSILTKLGHAIAEACGVLTRDDWFCTLPIPDQKKYCLSAQFAVDPEICAAEVIPQMQRAIGYHIFGCSTDRLEMAEREHVADLALVAWFALRDTLNGTAVELPEWERRCLTFSGEYDPALLMARPQGPVQ